MRRFRTGLVVGKFAPLHLGHEHLIRRAQADCDELFIVSYAKPERPDCGAERREHWLRARFPEVRSVVIDDARFGTIACPEYPAVPEDEADERAHRRFCGYVALRVFGVRPDAVFTSESYGDGFAAELTRMYREEMPDHPEVRHVLVDLDRTAFPVSGSKIRDDVHASRIWLHPEVYASFVRRVCFLGGESTGKSTLTARLAERLGTVHVEEFGRELWDLRGGQLSFDDMELIGVTQIEREERALRSAARWLFCDTSPLTTVFYSRHIHGRASSALESMSFRSYDLTFVCAPDFPFVQDGTRQDENFRQAQHHWYLETLEARGIWFTVLEGTLDARIRAVEARLRSL